MSSASAFTSSVLALVTSLTAACSTSDDGDCREAGCAQGLYCDLRSGLCRLDAEATAMGLAEYQFRGDFHCMVFPDDASADLSGTSTVVGRKDSRALGLTEPATCAMSPGATGAIRVSLRGRRGQPGSGVIDSFALVLELVAQGAPGSQSLAVAPGYLASGKVVSGQVGATLFSWEGDAVQSSYNLLYQAFGQAGTLSLTGTPAVGQAIAGVIDITLSPAGSGKLGAACMSDEQCDFNDDLICASGVSDTCTSLCDTDGDCERYGATCFAPGLDRGWCVTPCASNADCQGREGCSKSLGGQGRCVPLDLFVGSGDPGALGATCHQEADCAGGRCVTSDEGGAGFCTVACDSDDDCFNFYDVRPACVPLDEKTKICAPRCGPGDACPADHECVRDGMEKLCKSPVMMMPADPCPGGKPSNYGGSCGNCGGIIQCDGTCSKPIGTCCETGATQCLENDPFAMRSCVDGEWTTVRCEQFSMCAQHACRPVCDGFLASATSPAICMYPALDAAGKPAGRVWRNDVVQWPDGSVGGVVENLDSRVNSAMVPTASTWPFAFVLRGGDGAAIAFELARFSFPVSRVMVIHRIKRAGQVADATRVRVLAVNASNLTLGSVEQPLSTDYQNLGVEVTGETTASFSYGAGQQNVLGIVPVAAGGVPDAVHLNWMLVTIEP